MSTDAVSAVQPQPSAPSVAPTEITTTKVKDPKRVAAGKRLAQISREAKERKMRQKIEAETEASRNSDWLTTMPVLLGVIGLLLAGLSAYYTRAQAMAATKKPQTQSHPQQKTVNIQQPSTNNLDVL